MWELKEKTKLYFNEMTRLSDLHTIYVSETDIALRSVILTTCDIVRLSGVKRWMPIQRSIRMNSAYLSAYLK